MVVLDDSDIRFAHPLLASICYERAPLWKRRAVHRVLAGVVADLEERARHLALAAEGPDESVASALDTAGERAAARGATAAAAGLFELAAEMTPSDPGSARRRRFQAAHFRRLAGESERAIEILEGLRAEAPSGVERADVLFELALTFGPQLAAMIDLCDESLAEAAGDDARSARVLAFRSLVRLNQANVHAALADARAALEKAERTSDGELLAVSIARVGQVETWSAEITPGLLDRGAQIEESHGLVLEYNQSPRVYLARLLARLGELGRARAILEELEAQAAARGDEITRMVLIFYLSLVEWTAGRWQLALEYANAARELGEQVHTSTQRGWEGRVNALIEMDLGLIDEARASAENALAHARAVSNDAFILVTLGVLGRLELVLGNIEAAASHLRELPARLLAGGVNDPTLPLWADAIETLVALGELEHASEYVEHYEANAHRLGSPLAREGALRCRGLLAAAEGDLEAAFEAFERVLSEQPAPPWPLERARTLL